MFYNLNLSHKFYIISKLPMDNLIYFYTILLVLFIPSTCSYRFSSKFEVNCFNFIFIKLHN